jgi:hypothetical protein
MLLPDSALARDPANPSAPDPTPPDYLHPGQRDFPRNSVCVDGRVVRVSILSRSSDFSPETCPFQLLCIPSSVHTISSNCFYACPRLSYLAFEAGSKLSTLGTCAFLGCSSLRTVCFPASIQAIHHSCFKYCSDLTKVIFEPGCTISTLPSGAFGCCPSLRSISLASSLRLLRANCFILSKGLEDLGSEVECFCGLELLAYPGWGVDTPLSPRVTH